MTQKNSGDMQQTIRDLQQQLHEENQRRFLAIEKALNKISERVGEVIANTADLPQLREDVDSLKDGQSKIKGIAAVIVFLGGAADALFYVFRR